MSRTPPVGVVRRLCAGTVERAMGDGAKVKAFVASTETPDRYDDVVDQATWKLDNYRANPVMPTDHCYEVENLVCNGDAAVVDGKLTVVPMNWSAKVYAQEVKADVDAGIIRAVSVGFLPGRAVQRRALPPEHRWFDAESWGYVYYDCELLEISFVVVPANCEALATDGLEMAAKSFDIDTLVKRITADVLAKITSDPTFLARSLAAPVPPSSGGASGDTNDDDWFKS